MYKYNLIRVGLSVMLVFGLTGFAATPVTLRSAQAQQPAAFDCAAVTEIPQSECEALVAFYVSTGGPEWSDNNGWLQTDTPCTWYGVICNEGHVTRLILDWNHLQGTIPSEIANLLQLQILRLDGNWLSGSIPKALGKLTNLEQLFLYRNQLTGSIPPELGNLVNLNYLMLFDNELSGPIPSELGNMRALWRFSLQGNQLSGSIPPSLGHLTNLCDLNLSFNQLTGTLPPELGALTRLGWCRSLAHDEASWFGHGSASLSIPSSTRYPQPQVGYLNVASNHLSGAIPAELGQLNETSGLEPPRRPPLGR